jgi:hypothetical protein
MHGVDSKANINVGTQCTIFHVPDRRLHVVLASVEMAQ